MLIGGDICYAVSGDVVILVLSAFFQSSGSLFLSINLKNKLTELMQISLVAHSMRSQSKRPSSQYSKIRNMALIFLSLHRGSIDAGFGSNL